MSFEIETIPDDCFVLRQTVPIERTGTKKRKFPNESHFELRDGEAGLSVNWDRYMDVEKNYLLISLTKSLNSGNLLDYSIFRIFKYPVSLFRGISKIEDVKHVPIFNGNPSAVGFPNNQAHSEVRYKNDVEIFVKLSDYCNTCFDDSYCKFDLSSINNRVLELRGMLNNNSFHKL
jgi:hypothetical protein